MAFAPVFGRVFPTTFDRRAAVGNGLLNNLIAYWPGNEASGDALDAHTGGLMLAQVGSPGSVAGIVYAGARQTYETTQTDKHFYRADALLRPGNTDFTFATWVNLTVADAVPRGVLGTWQPNPDSEFLLLKTDANKVIWIVSAAGNPNSGITNVISASALSTSVWHLLVCWHDAASDQIGLQIDNGVPVTAATSAGVATGSGTFRLARFWTNDGSQITRVWRGAIGPVALWKSAAGGGGVLTAAQRTALYNGGAGLAYTAFMT